MQSIKVDGATVSFDVQGQGPALVLVSGTGGNLHSNWDHLVERFAESRTVVRVDYSGSGLTEDSGEPLTVEMLANQVMAAAAAAKADGFDLVGYSLGSAIAIHIAATRPDLVRSLVLLAGFSDGTGTRFGLQSGLWLDMIRMDPRLFARTIVLTGLSPAYVAAMSEEDIAGWIDSICANNRWDGIARQIDLDRRIDVTQMLPAVQARTLVIGCRNDYVFPITHARQLAVAIASAQYAELDSGHLAPFEQPVAFSEMVCEFIEQADSGAT